LLEQQAIPAKAGITKTTKIYTNLTMPKFLFRKTVRMLGIKF